MPDSADASSTEVSGSLNQYSNASLYSGVSGAAISPDNGLPLDPKRRPLKAAAILFEGLHAAKAARERDGTSSALSRTSAASGRHPNASQFSEAAPQNSDDSAGAAADVQTGTTPRAGLQVPVNGPAFTKKSRPYGDADPDGRAHPMPRCGCSIM